MVKFKSWCSVFLLCGFFLLLPLRSLYSQEVSPVEKRGVSYKIVPGDCLWNIAKKFYNNPFNWKLIWKANPYVKNPDLIYPDDILFIPEVETPSIVSTEVEEAKNLEDKEEVRGHEDESNVMPERTYTPVSTEERIIEKRDTFQLNSESFVVEDAKLDYDGIIIGVSEKKLLIAEGDIVHLNIGKDKNLEIGDRLRILRKISSVRDPVTGEVRGSVVLRVGILEVVDVASKVSSARIIMSHYVIQIGDLVKKM